MSDAIPAADPKAGSRARLERAVNELAAAAASCEPSQAQRVRLARLFAGEFTSSEVASLAARGLNDPYSLSVGEIQKICASALTQAG